MGGKQQCRIACYHPHERVNFIVCIFCPIFPNILKWGEILCKGLVKAIKWERKQWLLLEFLEVPSQSTRCVLFLPFLSNGHKQIKQVKHWKVGPFGKDGKPFRKIQLLCVFFCPTIPDAGGIDSQNLVSPVGSETSWKNQTSRPQNWPNQLSTVEAQSANSLPPFSKVWT